MDLEHTHARLIATFKGLANGKAIGETVPVPPPGTSTKIFTARRDAAKHLDETFVEDYLTLVDQAFKRLGLERASNKKDEVAAVILNTLVPPKRPRR